MLREYSSSRLFLLGFLLVFMMNSFEEDLFALTKGALKFRTKSVDFGNVMQGQELKYRFHFKNEGKRKIRIKGVHSSCGCTVLALDTNKVYLPDELGYIDLLFRTERFLGRVHKIVTIMTDEKLSPNRTLSILANIMSDYAVDKPVLDFGKKMSSEMEELELVLSPADTFDLLVSQVEYDKKYISLSFFKSERNWKIRVKLKEELPIGRFNDVISIITNSKNMEKFDVLVRADVQGAVKYAPNYLEFGAIDKEGNSKRLIQFESSREFKLIKKNVKIFLNGDQLPFPINFVKWSSIMGEDHKQNVEITLNNPVGYSGSVHGNIEIEVSDEVENKVLIPFYAFFL